LGGHKHKFDAPNSGERDSWFAAVKKIAEDAKAKKEDILASESYKETLAKFSEYNSIVTFPVLHGSKDYITPYIR
jgi:hypothetical protein